MDKDVLKLFILYLEKQDSLLSCERTIYLKYLESLSYPMFVVEEPNPFFQSVGDQDGKPI
jgi:hypothetical protein